MNIVVIDDEKIIANGFYSLISSHFTNHNVFVFYKSIDLLEFSNSNKIDLLVCDIDMPKMNGIELAKTLKTKFPFLRIIFLTGMDTFDYIYEATKVDNSQYILKIEEDDVLLSSISKVIDEIETLNQTDINHQKLQKEYEELQKDKKTFYVKELIQTGANSLCLDFDSMYFNALFLSKNVSKEDFAKLENLCVNILPILKDYIFKIEENVVVMFTNTIFDKTSFEEIKEAFLNENGITINSCVSKKVVKTEKLSLIFSRMNDLAKISDPSKGFFYIYENEISQELDDNQKLMAQIKDYIYKNTDGDLSLKKIGLVMHYNESYLSRLFKKQTGTNFKNFVTQIKIEKAIHLLSETDTLVKDIAKNLGFESTSHFQFFFKKNLGVTPQEYRHEHIKFNK